MGLLKMVRYAGETECRKHTIHSHFGFDDQDGNCGSCDVCTDTEAWQDSHLPEPKIARSAEDLDTESPLRRGDWIEARRLGLCCVQRVHRRGRRWRVDVELARDLSSRSFDLRPDSWRRVERD